LTDVAEGWYNVGVMGKKAVQRLIDVRPDLVKQLHQTKNDHLNLETLGLYSNYTATWICPKCNYEYPMIIANKTKHRQNCPRCMGKVATADNNLAVKFPEIASEWHPTKNKGNPEDYPPFSSKNVWWICSKDNTHVYPSDIRNRTSGGTGCPFCINFKIDANNCLAVKFPELLDEWDYEANYPLTPYDVAPCTATRVHWKCKYGHKYKTRISHRTDGHGCRRCKNTRNSKLELFVYCELKYFYPDAEFRYRFNGYECDVYLPSHKIAVEIDGYVWHVNKQDKDRAKAEYLKSNGITLINIRGEGLEEVSSYTIRFGDKYDKLGLIKSLFEILYSLIKDNRLLNYSTSVNEEYYISEVKRLPAPPLSRSLSFANPQLAMQWDHIKNGKLTPLDVYVNGGEIVWWKCELGHSWSRKISDRNTFGRKCPECLKLKRESKKYLVSKKP
jgi:very-short-patch-repair endonuclease